MLSCTDGEYTESLVRNEHFPQLVLVALGDFAQTVQFVLILTWKYLLESLDYVVIAVDSKTLPEFSNLPIPIKLLK